MFFICISLMISVVEHVPVGHLYIFFGKMSMQVLCSLKKLGYLGFSAIGLYEILVYLGY